MKELSSEEKIDLYRAMTRARKFGTLSLKQYNAGKMGGFLLLSAGQEGAAIVARFLMRGGDQLICGPRSAAHAIAAGMSMNEMMTELYGRSTGSSKGKGGTLAGTPFAETGHPILLPGNPRDGSVVMVAGGGVFTTTAPDAHVPTNIAIIEQFLPAKFTVADEGGGLFQVSREKG